ncbi:PREDICTED: uncharacterized protein LOC108566395 isoform X2 [Nicrophorus vespilloides]|uniref:Uncharacterized protein LOC108566395 isoform X2 n=1 Tax=Nicrophorus vespilloides TaxID=110193 RepID=A0ABM1N4J5_NICVS|nr:PREDICTED: uncharacterized protein LOC108566395 isoform X2 [Nicrophorus vespilloides]
MESETEFNSLLFEKKLSNLKDSQDSINGCCHWCLENRQHHKKIVNIWLNVLKRVRIEQRLTLFYLANDVIQYSKRKNYDFVESWGTALQKATTMVRDEKVKNKILRIFKIWEERSVYGEEFITDLSGLISASPTNKKIEEMHDFQANYLINKIRSCSRLQDDTDSKLKLFKQHNPKLLDGEALVSSLKDRAHVDDVEKEMDDYVSHMEKYINALKLEIRARNNLVNLLLNAETHLEKDRKDVKVVAVAYKSFATRVKNLKKKLDEKKLTLSSPIPSPDINAPSPSPDSDIDLPDIESAKKEITFSNPGFYNPVTTVATTDASNYANNGFTSFIGSNLPFNIQDLNSTTLFTDSRQSKISTTNIITNSSQNSDSNYTPANSSLSSLFTNLTQPPPPPVTVQQTASTYNYTPAPLAPPPLPPFAKSDYDSGYGDFSISNQTTSNYDNSYSQSTSANNDPYQSYNSSYSNEYNNTGDNFNQTTTTDSTGGYNSYDAYNPEDETETWDAEGQWDQPPLDTPASPPLYDKESYAQPIEYHDGQHMMGAVDVDHRILTAVPSAKDKKKDVDHRNLISLIGSPKSHGTSSEDVWTGTGDQDYRKPIETCLSSPIKSPRKVQDNVESIDMDLSDGEEVGTEKGGELLPPPPPPFADFGTYEEIEDDATVGGQNRHEQAAVENTSWTDQQDALFRGRGNSSGQYEPRGGGEFNGRGSAQSFQTIRSSNINIPRYNAPRDEDYTNVEFSQFSSQEANGNGTFKGRGSGRVSSAVTAAAAGAATSVTYRGQMAKFRGPRAGLNTWTRGLGSRGNNGRGTNGSYPRPVRPRGFHPRGGFRGGGSNIATNEFY